MTTGKATTTGEPLVWTKERPTVPGLIDLDVFALDEPWLDEIQMDLGEMW